jgi:ubiquinone/menaquinone biosynthesis C-methylase UbiE
MSDAESLRRFGQVFDAVAKEYDAVRRGYPESLVDACMSHGGLHPGSQVVEVGCGTGKLTELLAARDLAVTAIEPGPSMAAAARRRLGDLGDRVRFQISTFEEARLSESAYDALFSATAFHWPDPGVSWAKAASVLRPGGLLALLAHVAVHDEQSARADEAFLELLARHAPEVVAGWRLRELDTILAGVEERRVNASAVWDWIMGERHGLAVEQAAELFDNVAVLAESVRVEETADQILALLRTTSLYFRIEEPRRPAFEADLRRLVGGLGGTVESALATVLMTAHRTGA